MKFGRIVVQVIRINWLESNFQFDVTIKMAAVTSFDAGKCCHMVIPLKVLEFSCWF